MTHKTIQSYHQNLDEIMGLTGIPRVPGKVLTVIQNGTLFRPFYRDRDGIWHGLDYYGDNATWNGQTAMWLEVAAPDDNYTKRLVKNYMFRAKLKPLREETIGKITDHLYENKRVARSVLRYRLDDLIINEPITVYKEFLG